MQTTIAALRDHRCLLVQTPRGQMRQKVLMSAIASVAITAGSSTQVVTLTLDNLDYFNKQETFCAFLAFHGAANFVKMTKGAQDSFAALSAGNPQLFCKGTTQNKVITHLWRKVPNLQILPLHAQIYNTQMTTPFSIPKSRFGTPIPTHGLVGQIYIYICKIYFLDKPS